MSDTPKLIRPYSIMDGASQLHVCVFCGGGYLGFDDMISCTCRDRKYE